jgi:anti-sigma factor RsiW
MNCNETRRLLDADIDGEVDLVTHLDIEKHLGDCADCARLAAQSRARREVLQTLPRFSAPQRLREIIAPAHVPNETSPSRSSKWLGSSAWAWSGALAAAASLALIIGYSVGGAHARSDLLLNEAISDHVRSLQTGHLKDVVSTDQHTVKPWFTGKIDFSPPVVDLTPNGFPLEGGRLEYLDGRPAAALVFRRGQHPINLFIWPGAENRTARAHTARDGYTARLWSEAGFNFLAVSEIPAADLSAFVEAYRTHLPSAPATN